MNGQTVVTVDGQKLGHVVADHDDCTVVESGRLRKTQHAIPHQLLHGSSDEIRATVSKEVVESSPRADHGSFDREAVLVHYGLIDPALADPMLLEADEDGVDSAEAAVDNAEATGARAGVTPPPAERAAQREKLSHPEGVTDEPKIVEKLPGGANDPSGTTSNYH
ncbi:MAG TPA: hypothetical protein VHC45_10200 [Gaiellaceae bacterium]|nr:hypothetical protein [Gaiellaceae bacterium]